MKTTITITINHSDIAVDQARALSEFVNADDLAHSGSPHHASAAWNVLNASTKAGGHVTVETVPGWLAGWNVPGCLPDCEPQLLEDYDDALDYLAQMLEVFAGQHREAALPDGDVSDIERAEHRALLTAFDEAAAQVRKRIGVEADQQAAFWLSVRETTYWVAREQVPYKSYGQGVKA